MACRRGQQTLGKQGQQGQHGDGGVNGVQAHAKSSSMARRSRHSWADRHMEGGKDGVFPAVHDDKQDAGGLQRFGPVQSGPAGRMVDDGPLKTR